MKDMLLLNDLIMELYSDILRMQNNSIHPCEQRWGHTAWEIILQLQ